MSRALIDRLWTALSVVLMCAAVVILVTRIWPPRALQDRAASGITPQ